MMAYFLMQCWHHPGQDGARDGLRPLHRAWVQTGGDGLVSVLIGSAMTDETGGTVGNFGLLEARSLEDAHHFAEGDPYRRGAIVARIAITPLPDSFQAERITAPMSPRLA